MNTVENPYVNGNAYPVYFILDEDKNVVPCDDRDTYRRFMRERINFEVGRTEENGVWVSTVFLGQSYGPDSGSTKPFLFETTIFGGKYSGNTCRYPSWNEALMGHRAACLYVGVDDE